MISKTIFKKTIFIFSKAFESPEVKSSVRFNAIPNKILMKKLTKDQADVLKRLEIRKRISDLESLKPTEQGVEPGWFKKLPGAIRSALILSLIHI